MSDRLLVAFSPFLLEDDLHLSLRMLHYRRLHFDLVQWHGRIAAQSVLARTNLVNLGEGEYVANFDISEPGYCEEVTWCQGVFSSG